jgi:hypothetical protein
MDESHIHSSTGYFQIKKQPPYFVRATSWNPSFPTGRLHSNLYSVRSALAFDPIPPLSLWRPLNRWASGFGQSVLQANVFDPQIGFTTLRADLTGEGQVVNVAGTGVDIQNVFFYNASHSLASVTNRTNWAPKDCAD